MILLPGLDGTGRLFEDFITQLPPNWSVRVIAYPQIGQQDYDTLADLVAAQLPESAPYVLVAESFAGPLALQISTRTGANLNALVLSTTFVQNPRPRLSRFAPLSLREVLLSWRAPDWLFRWLLTGFDADSGLLKNLRDVLGEVPPRILRLRLESVMNVDVTAQLQTCRVPILHLYARRDHLIPHGAARLVQRLRPEITSLGLDGPHFLLQTRPRECLSAIREFLLNQGVPA